MLPEKFFERELLKGAKTLDKWNALSEHDRLLINFTFFEIALGPELRSRITPLPVDVRPTGRRLFRFVMDMGFGWFVFGILEGRLAMALIDFHVDERLLTAEYTSPRWRH